jgi:hypothetical protein
MGTSATLPEAALQKLAIDTVLQNFPLSRSDDGY